MDIKSNLTTVGARLVGLCYLLPVASKKGLIQSVGIPG